MILDLRHLAGKLAFTPFDHRRLDDNERWHMKLLRSAGIEEQPCERFEDYMVVLQYFSGDPELRRPMNWAEFALVFRDPDAYSWLGCIDHPIEILRLLSDKVHDQNQPFDKYPVELLTMLVREVLSPDA